MANEPTQVSQAVSAVFSHKLPFIVNETVEENGKNRYKEVARFEMPYPVLSDFGIDAKISQKDGKDEVDEDGIPSYEDEKMDWLMYAIVQQLKAQNRNKIGANNQLKDGMKFPENFEELVAVGERSGEALKARHAARQSFIAYLKSKNKKDVIVKILSDLLVDPSSISVARDDFADALQHHLTQWVPSLDEADKLRFTKTLERAGEALNSRGQTLDDLKG